MKKIILCLALVAGVAAAQAHFVFAVIADGSLQVGLEDRPGISHVPNVNDKGERLEFFGPNKKKLTAKLGEDGYRRAALGDLKAAGAQIRYGVLDRGAEVYLLDYYAKAAATPQDSEQKIGLAVELFVKKDDLGWYVEAHKNGKLQTNLDLVVHYPGKEEEEIDAKIDETGRFDLRPGQAGRLILRTVVKSPLKGEMDGKKYEENRAYSTLVINHITP